MDVYRRQDAFGDGASGRVRPDRLRSWRRAGRPGRSLHARCRRSHDGRSRWRRSRCANWRGVCRRRICRGRGRRNRGARSIRGAGHHLRLPWQQRFPHLHQERRKRCSRERAARRSRTTGDHPARPHRWTRAQPDALRAADDSDQPRDYRRGRAGWLASARIPAGSHVRSRNGRRLRRARAHRRADGQFLRNDQRLTLVQPRPSPCCSSSWASRCST